MTALSNAAQPAGYNERLFGGGIRGWFHSARFRWVANELSSASCSELTFLELGCFDGKIIKLLNGLPRRYVGYDANWEGGLDLARRNWSDHPEFEFKQCGSPADFDPDSSGFDVGICMETLEHVAVDDVGPYLEMLSRRIKGTMLITVPNEQGIFFLVKHLLKRLTGRGEQYSAADVFWTTLGVTGKVKRHEHKGFNWRELVDEIEQHFTVQKIQGIPFPFLPPSLNFTIGIAAIPRCRASSK